MSKLFNRIKTKQGYKYIAEFLTLMLMIAVVYGWFIILAATQ